MVVPNREQSKIKGSKVKIGIWNIQGGVNAQFDAETICKDL